MDLDFNDEEFQKVMLSLGSDSAGLLSGLAIVVKRTFEFMNKILPPPIVMSCIETFKEDMDETMDDFMKEAKEKMERIKEVVKSEEDLGIEDDDDE